MSRYIVHQSIITTELNERFGFRTMVFKIEMLWLPHRDIWILQLPFGSESYTSVDVDRLDEFDYRKDVIDKLVAIVRKFVCEECSE